MIKEWHAHRAAATFLGVDFAYAGTARFRRPLRWADALSNLGNSGCAVSALCLGTMTFGAESDEAESHAALDRFVEAGGTLVDTADVYSAGSLRGDHRPVARRPARRRDRARSCSRPRAASRWTTAPTAAGSRPATSPGRSTRRCGRLGVDAVDLYQVHAFDPHTPLEETLRTLDGFVRAGKIRYYGLLELHRLAAHQGGAPGPRPGAGRAGDPAAAVHPDRARDRVGDRAGRARRRDGHAAVEPARWWLAVRQVPARPATDRRHPPRRRPRARHGGLGPPGHRADLGHHRRRPAGRRGPRRLDGRGRAGLGHRPARRDLDDPRRAHRRAARGQPALRRPPAHRRGGRVLDDASDLGRPTIPTARWPRSSAPATWPAASTTGGGPVRSALQPVPRMSCQAAPALRAVRPGLRHPPL